MVVNGLNVVHAALHPRAYEHLDGQAGHGGVGAYIGQGFDAQAQNFAVLGQGQRRFGLNVAAVCAAQKFFAAVGNPFHWPGQSVCTKSSDHVFCIGACFHAKATAHIAHKDADFFFVNAEQIGNCGANACWHLTAHANGQSTVFWVGQHASGFNGQSGDALVHNVQVNHMCGLCKGRLGGRDVAIASFCHAVVGRFGEQRGIGRQCIGQGACTLQGVKLNLNGLSCIARVFFSVSHDRRNGFAHKSNGVCGQGVACGGRQGATICPFEVHGTRHGLDACSQEVLTCDEAIDARHGLGSKGVKTGNLGVWIGGAKENQIRLTGQGDVVCVLTCA